MTGYVAYLSWKSGARAIEKLDRLRSTMAVNVLILTSMIRTSSLEGMLGYIFSMTNDTSLIPCLCGTSSRSSIRCTAFFMLKALGNGICKWINLVRYLASLYAGAPRQFIMGLIGYPALWILGNPLMLGAVGFIFVSLVLLSFVMVIWQSFIVALTWFWNVRVGSLLRTVKLLLSMKSCTLSW